MKKIRGTKKKRIFFIILNLALVILAAACFMGVAILSNLLDSQKVAERWQGENELAFSQVSCYIPVDEKISLDDVYAFRYAILAKLKEAALDTEGTDGLFVDAWCTTGKVNVSTSLGKGDVSVTAVGGSFFDFHPILLKSGSYITENDLMKDRVLLDEETAWMLFGGTDLQGMELKVNGVPFVVAGVIEREDDFASRKAYTAGMGIYMSYDAYVQLAEGAGINCYELVMAEPVDGFVLSFVKEKFPIGSGEIVDNTNRYSFGSLTKLIGQFGSRSMQTLGVIYPYWENAARCTEDWCTLFMFLGLAATVLPVVTVIVIIVRYLRRGKDKLEDDVIPKLKDGAEEAIRVRQRRRWEKKHGMHEKN